MPRKSRAQKFAPLEDEDIRSQIPTKILPLIEQLVLEQCAPINAAVTLRMKLLEIQVRESARRLDQLAPQPRDEFDPMEDWDSDTEQEEEPSQDNWEDPDEDRDEEIPF